MRSRYSAMCPSSLSARAREVNGYRTLGQKKSRVGDHAECTTQKRSVLAAGEILARGPRAVLLAGIDRSLQPLERVIHGAAACRLGAGLEARRGPRRPGR